jgi:hypothetical protein
LGAVHGLFLTNARSGRAPAQDLKGLARGRDARGNK